MNARCAAVLFLGVGLPACTGLKHSLVEPEAAARGPLPTRVQHPMKLGILAFRPRQAQTLAAGQSQLRVLSAYTSIYENGNVVDESVVFDGELWTNSVSLRYGLAQGTDIELELGVLYASSGFLDGFIEGWHNTFALPGGGYDERPKYEYEMRVEQNGQEVYALDGNELGWLDTPLILTQQLLPGGADAVALALRAGIELPTGSESSGFGNGSVDYGLSLIASQDCGRWSWSAGLDWVEAQEPSSFADQDIEYAADWGAQAGLEYRWNEDLSLLGGLHFDSRVTSDIEIKELNNPMLGLDLGLAWDTRQAGQWHLGFSEDLIAESGPDFGLFMGWTTGF